MYSYWRIEFDDIDSDIYFDLAGCPNGTSFITTPVLASEDHLVDIRWGDDKDVTWLLRQPGVVSMSHVGDVEYVGPWTDAAICDKFGTYLRARPLLRDMESQLTT
jgi:hypothetical protein